MTGRRTLRILTITLAVAIVALRGDPDRDNYTLKFPGTPPTSGAQALSTFNDRSGAVLQFLACGNEAAFADGSALRNRPDKNPKYADAEDVGEGMLHMIQAKMLVVSGWPNLATQVNGTHEFACKQTVTLSVKPPRKTPAGPDPSDPDFIKAVNKKIADQTTANDALNSANIFGSVCAGEAAPLTSDAKAATVTVSYSLSRDCLRKQVNQYMMAAYVNGVPGSTGLVCFPFPLGSSDGEWDVNLKEITRIYDLNEQTGRSVLDDDVRTYIRDRLLTLDGPPGQESYNIGQCGDTESSVGPPDSRADERDWTHSALSDVGDALGWLLKWLLRLLALAIALSVAFAVLAALVGPAAAAAAITALGVLGAVFLTLGDIPESENHRLMIESSRFLNNQIIVNEIDPANSNKHYIVDDQTKVREWLLKRLQRIAKEDFVEYNARPYQRYSLAAIRNLADFARDQSLVKAARGIMDMAVAKMALASNRGRRLPPFRRLMETVQVYIEPDGHDPDSGDLAHNGVFDLERGADHQIALMLIYAGQTQQTPSGALTPGSFDEMSFAAASGYRPPEPVLDIAIDKSTSYQQKVKHDGAEIYSSAPGYLLTAGGIQSGPSSTIEIAGLSLGGSILGIIPLSNNKDRGAALPTTLMLAGGTDRSSLEAFLRIAGHRQSLDSSNATYDNNLCVYKGFACGLNIATPEDMKPCFVPGPAGSPSQWTFFDTESGALPCTKPFAGGPPVMIARYLETCHNDQTGECADNVGFFEAVSAPGVNFLLFQNQILANNPHPDNWLRLIGGGLFGSNRTLLTGEYVSFSGEKIEFNTSAHQLDSNQTGIVSVNGATTHKLADWKRLEGDFFTGDASSLQFQFSHPTTHHGFSVDLSDWNNPQSGVF